MIGDLLGIVIEGFTILKNSIHKLGIVTKGFTIPENSVHKIICVK